MTSEEASDFLAKCSKRNHGVEFEKSHIYVRGVKTHRIKRACDKLDHDGEKVLALISDVPCSCGADAHNAKVDEALKTLNPVVALPACMNAQPLTVEETRRVIDDFTDLCGGPEHGVRTMTSLYKTAVALREFLLSKGYTTDGYYIETPYKPRA